MRSLRTQLEELQPQFEEEVLDGTSDNVNGRLVALAKDEEKASNFLRELSEQAAAQIPYTRIHNYPVTLASRAADYWSFQNGLKNKQSLKGVISKALNEHEEVFKRLGMQKLTLNEEAECKRFMEECGSTRGMGSFHRNQHVYALSRRCVLFVGLSTKTKLAEIALDHLNLRFPQFPETIFELAGLIPSQPLKTKNQNNAKPRLDKPQTGQLLQMPLSKTVPEGAILSFAHQIELRRIRIMALKAETQMQIERYEKEIAALEKVQQMLDLE